MSRDKSVELEANGVGSPANLARKEMKCIACSHTIILQDDLPCAVFIWVFIQTCKAEIFVIMMNHIKVKVAGLF